MSKSISFSPEVRERAVRMVLEHRDQHPSLWAAIQPIAPKIGCTAQTLNNWVRQHERDTGTREGLSHGRSGRERLSASYRVDEHSGMVSVSEPGSQHPEKSIGSWQIRPIRKSCAKRIQRVDFFTRQLK